MSSHARKPPQAKNPGAFGLRLDPDLGRRLRRACHSCNVTVSVLVAELLEVHLDEYERTHRVPVTRLRPGKKLRLY